MMPKLAAGMIVVALTAGPAFAQQAIPQAPKDPPYPWQPEEPQGHWSQTWHDGFRAGASAANRDAHDEVPLNLSNHQQFRRPDLAPVASQDFRDGYQAAYDMVRDHFSQNSH